jgi:AcrR family transcriptional regulator
VFLQSGANGARIQQLADAAGVNPALLYQHFESKEELFEEAVTEPLAAAFEASLADIPPVGPFDASGEQMRALTRTYVVNLLEAMDQSGGLLGVVLFSDADTGREYFQTRLEPLLKQVRDVVVTHLPVWNHKEFDPDTMLSLLFGMAWYTAIEGRFGSGPPRDREAVADQIIGLIFDGLLEP